MDSPIFVAADEPLVIFRSASAATIYVEPIDVEEGIYTPYDSVGRLLRFEVRSRTRTILRVFRRRDEWVELVAAEGVPTHQDDLRRLLVDVLTRYGESPVSLTQLSLEALGRHAIATLGFTD